MGFACKACGSPAVVYPDHLSDDGPIKCQRCDAVLCTVGEFRFYIEGGVVAVHGSSEGSTSKAAV